MRVRACQAAKITENITVVRWPPQPGNAGDRLLQSTYPPPPCLNTQVLKPSCYFVFPPLAAVDRACPAVLRVMLCLHGITGNSSLKLKPHPSERRERSSL